jgi:beta-lactamase superfamily II metal-dependent hydrolase
MSVVIGRASTIRDYITDVIGLNTQSIDHLVITHPDGDHYNLLPEVLGGFEIGHLSSI